MEVGAVKQAFNNEVILLKKKLTQAKIQVIHKLTRKAKTLTEKKPPEHLKEKLKRKAESAVNEVLIIKKIKSRDIAKFIITHTGKVSDYLNRPQVDNDKACARLVLHKSLQDKYKSLRNTFGNIPIKDLFMSRQERRKIKKEARDEQKNKKKRKQGKVTNSVGDWDVEDVDMGDGKAVSQKDVGSGDEISGDEREHSEEEKITKSNDDNASEVENQDFADSDVTDSVSPIDERRSDDEEMKNDESDDEIGNESSNNEIEGEVSKIIKPKPEKVKPVEKSKPPKSIIDKIEIDFDAIMAKKQTKVKENKTAKKVKENKNKNLKEKLENRKFKKDDDDGHIEGRKVVDPFFITATGGNYLSLAEPRQPDEIKEVHKQGNRQERRAVMFGRKFKPRNDFRETNFKPNKFGDDSRRSGGNKNDRFNNHENVNRNSKFNDRNGQFNDSNSKFNDRNSKFNDDNVDKKEEKLHPSWEAKRKLKSMSLLPSQGKKIVFDDN